MSGVRLRHTGPSLRQISALEGLVYVKDLQLVVIADDAHGRKLVTLGGNTILDDVGKDGRHVGKTTLETLVRVVKQVDDLLESAFDVA